MGKVLSVTDANGVDISKAETHIANINPFRYRSYYYDTETKLYYLQSRYYNPEVGRFVNAATEGIGLTGTVSFPALHFGLLTFGFGAGASNYKLLTHYDGINS